MDKNVEKERSKMRNLWKVIISQEYNDGVDTNSVQIKAVLAAGNTAQQVADKVLDWAKKEGLEDIKIDHIEYTGLDDFSISTPLID